jgi:hypothetical protein
MNIGDFLTIIGIAIAILAFMPNEKLEFIKLKIRKVDIFLLVSEILLLIYCIQFDTFLRLNLYSPFVLISGGLFAKEWAIIILALIATHLSIIVFRNKIYKSNKSKIIDYLKGKVDLRSFESLIYIIDKIFYNSIHEALTIRRYEYERAHNSNAQPLNLNQYKSTNKDIVDIILREVLVNKEFIHYCITNNYGFLSIWIPRLTLSDIYIRSTFNENFLEILLNRNREILVRELDCCHIEDNRDRRHVEINSKIVHNLIFCGQHYIKDPYFVAEFIAVASNLDDQDIEIFNSDDEVKYYSSKIYCTLKIFEIYITDTNYFNVYPQNIHLGAKYKEYLLRIFERIINHDNSIEVSKNQVLFYYSLLDIVRDWSTYQTDNAKSIILEILTEVYSSIIIFFIKQYSDENKLKKIVFKRIILNSILLSSKNYYPEFIEKSFSLPFDTNNSFAGNNYQDYLFMSDCIKYLQNMFLEENEIIRNQILNFIPTLLAVQKSKLDLSNIAIQVEELR